MKSVHFIALLLLSVTFFACQKELQFSDTENPDPGTPPPANGDIKGTWKFLFMQMAVKTTTESGQGGTNVKGVASYDTKTISNAGTIKIDASTCVGTGFAYALDAKALMETYVDNVKLQTQTVDLKFAVPPYNFTSNYKQIGADSLCYESGFVMSVSDGSSPFPVQNPAAGSKFQIRSDTLIMSIKDGLQQTMNQGGVDIAMTQDTKVDIFLKRQ